MKEENPPFPELPNEISDVVGRILSIEQLTSSPRKVVFRVVATQGDWVLKKTHLSRLPMLQHESRVLELLGRKKFSLAERCVLPATAVGSDVFQLSTYISGDSLRNTLRPGAAGGGNDAVGASARVLKELHSLPVENVGCADLLDSLLTEAAANMDGGLLDPEEFVELRPEKMIAWLQERRPRRFDVVLSHGDFRPKNIIWNGRSVAGLTDWEHSILASPLDR